MLSYCFSTFFFYLKESDPNPGPAKYGMKEQFGKARSKQLYKKRSPAFSFGYRTNVNFDDRVPGANRYTLPKMLGKDAKGNIVVPKGPSYTM